MKGGYGTEEIQKLIDVSSRRIKQYLPEDYEIDDISWNDTGFVLHIFNVRTIEEYQKGPVDRFLFFLSKSETETENMERFERKLQEFAWNWRTT